MKTREQIDMYVKDMSEADFGIGYNTGQVMKAMQISIIAHDGQVRPRGVEKGKPYFTHPARVAEQFSDWKFQAIGYLHDVIEDTGFTESDLYKMGVDADVVRTVKMLTKKEGENYFEFIMRMKDDPIANSIKDADLEDNMATLEEGSLKDKYRFAQYILGKA